jgi:hypothetical protein
LPFLRIQFEQQNHKFSLIKNKKNVQKIYSLHINNQIMKENKKLIEQFYGESIYSMNCFERLLQ